MFGGYFGDAVDIVSRTYFGHTVTIPALWFVPLNDPMKLLVYSMLFGVIHLFLGLGLKGYMLLKDGKVVDFICDVVLWYLLLLGLILMLLPTELFGSIAQMNIVFPPVLNSLAKGMAIVGALGILVMSRATRRIRSCGWRLARMICTILPDGCRMCFPTRAFWRSDWQPALSHRLSTRWEVWLEIMYLA